MPTDGAWPLWTEGTEACCLVEDGETIHYGEIRCDEDQLARA